MILTPCSTFWLEATRDSTVKPRQLVNQSSCFSLNKDHNNFTKFGVDVKLALAKVYLGAERRKSVVAKTNC